MVKRTALPARLVVAFNKVEIKVIAKKMLSTILLLLQSIIGVRRLAAVKRTALPVRLVAAFNKVEIKVIAEKVLSNHTFITSKSNQW